MTRRAGAAAGLVFVLLAAVVFLSGCDQASRTELRFGLASAPITLDPRFATDATSARINRLLYAQLVDFDAASRPVQGLADWERLGPTHYRFTLRDGRRAFHDGSRLTAEDVRATYASVLDPETASPHRASISLIRSMEVVDADTLDFRLERADPLFPTYLTLGILPVHAIESGRDFGQRPLGSGAFRFKAWPREGLLRLERVKDGQVIAFLHVPDDMVRVLKLLRGEIDLLQNDLPQELIRYADQRSEAYVRRRTGSNFSYLGFNFDDPQLADVRVRKAIAYAIDRDAIVEHLFGGRTRVAHALLPPEHWAGPGNLQGYDYDPERAQRLLKQAGYGPGTPLHVSYKTSSDPFRIRLATIIQHQLASVGIEVDLQSYDWATFYGDIKAGRFQLYSLSWVGIKAPDIFRYVFHSDSVPPKGANRGRFSDPVVDALIEKAQRAGSLQQRAEYYRALQKRLLEVLPYVPLWYEGHFFAARKSITGYELAPDGNYDNLVHVQRSAVAAR